MIDFLYTRWLIIKKQRLQHLFWIIFPFIITSLIVVQWSNIEEDAKIPVGFVIEDESELVEELMFDLGETTHIRPIYIDEHDGLRQLERHEFDSLFIIPEQYSEFIERGRRNNIVTSYYTDLSFGYVPVRETVLSLVQRDFVREETTRTIERLRNEYRIQEQWDKSELIKRSKAIEEEQRLIDVVLSFYAQDEAVTSEKRTHSPVMIWALMTFFATAMLFDWLIKERHPAIEKRLPFGRIHLQSYYIKHALLYTAILIFVDIVFLIVASQMFQVKVTGALFFNVLSFRLTINSIIFLIGRLLSATYTYYIVALFFTLTLLLFSGLIIPIDSLLERFSFLIYVHPLLTLEHEKYVNILLFISLIIVGLISYRKKVQYRA